MLRRAARAPCNADVAVYFGNARIALLAKREWRGTLTRTGMYDLIVDGSGACKDDATSPYALSFTIR